MCALVGVPIKWYRNVILLVVLYGCETWSLTLREERRTRVFDSRVLRRIFGPKRDEVTGEWRKVRKEELRDLYSSPSIIRVIKWRRMKRAEHAARMGETRGVFKGWWGTWGKETTWETQAQDFTSSQIVFFKITRQTSTTVTSTNGIVYAATNSCWLHEKL